MKIKKRLNISDWEIIEDTPKLKRFGDGGSVEKNKKILKEKGILPEQEFKRNKYQESLSNNLKPIGYDYNSFVHALYEKNKGREVLENRAKDTDPYASNLIPKSRLDAFNFYMGKPQKYNTFDVSDYRPSKEADFKTNYYKLNYFQDYYAPDSNVTDLENLFKTKSLAEIDLPFLFSKKEKQKVNAADAPVMANYTLSKGEDEKGKYYSYYDKWDIAPMDFGKPFEIYDRIYYDPSTNKIIPPKKPYIKKAPLPGQSVQVLEFKNGGSLKKYSDGGKKITIKTGTSKRNPETNIFEKDIFQISPKKEVLPKLQTREYYDNFVKSKNYKYELNYPEQLSIDTAKKIVNIPNTYGTTNSNTEAYDLYNKSYKEDESYLNNQVNAINYYDKQFNWLKGNMENPKYAERLKKEFENNAETVLLKRKNNLLNSPIDVNVKSRFWNPVPETPNVQPIYEYNYNEDIGEDVKTKTDKNRLTLLDPEYAKSRVVNGKKIIPTLAIHEGQHLITDQNKGMSDYAKNLYNDSYLPTNKKDNNQYYNNPTEMDARKKALDFDMEKLGIKKYEEDFKPKHYKKILKLKNKLNDDSLEFLEHVKPKNIQKIFNTIAYNDLQEQIPIAKNGGSINKYPNGGKPPKYEWSKGIDNIQPITQTQNNSSITTGNKKLSTEELKKAAEYTKKYNQQHLEEEYNNRQNKLKQSIDAQKQPLSLKNLQTQTQSTGDKFSLAMNSKYGNPKDYPTLSGYMQGLDYINPAKMIGDMTSGLGSVPQDIKEGNYLKAGLSVASPLAVGAIAGVGANSVKPFVNNLVNPLAGTGEVINNLGNKYLPNAYKLNPNAFKPNPNNFYRQVDTPTFNEGLESGLIRGKQDIGYSDESAMKMFGDDAYYNKGRLYYKNEKDYPYLFEANLPEDRFIPKVNGRTRKYTTENTRVRVSKEPLPINDPNIKTYKKDWLQGYKPIEIPKKQNGGNITRESEWELVNEDLPKAGNGLSLVKTLTPIGNKVIPRNPSLYKDAINNVDKIEHNINDRYRVQADDFTDKNYPTDYDEDSGHNDYVDALRHSATAMYTTSGQGNFLAPLKVPYTNVMGLAHELKGLGSYVSNPDKLTWQGAKQQLRETGSDLYNNFVGSMIGGLPINIENKEKILKFAKDKNILSDLSKKQNGGKLPKRRLNLNKSSDWEIVD